jgi:hydrogenase maturation protease
VTTNQRVVVIGLGNPWRGDDGAGWAVVGAVRAGVAGGADLLELDGETARIIDAWDGAHLAVVVDAVQTGAVPGTLHRLTGDELTATGPASSHGLGLEHAVALGRALDRLPERLVVLGVEGLDFEHGHGLSAGVAAAIEPAAKLVTDLIEGVS